MKRLLVALATIIAAPAFAQHEPSSDHRTRSSSHRELDTYYYERNGNTNRDFHLGGSRWKTLHHRVTSSEARVVARFENPARDCPTQRSTRPLLQVRTRRWSASVERRGPRTEI